MHPNNKFERNGIKKKLFNYYEFGKPLFYNDTYIKIGKRHFSGEDFGGI